MSAVARQLDPALQRRALRLSFGDGIAYAVMVGAGESFFTADAIRLGASALEVGLVIALPLLIGSLGPVTVVRLLGGAIHRRPLVATCALAQAAGLAAIAVLNATGRLEPAGLIALLCLHQVFGQAAGTAWSSWYGDVVPAAQRGHWFATRTRAVQAAAFVTLVGAGFTLHVVEPEGFSELPAATPGFAMIFGVAALARFVSSILLWLSPEPVFRGLASRARLGKFLRTASGRNVVFLLAGGLMYQASVYVGSPYFTPFMLEDLRLDYAQFTIALGCVVVAKVLTLPAWGRLVDRIGALRVYRLALLATALVPIPWMLADGAGGAWIAQALSGVAWGGHEVAIFALLLEMTRSGNRPQVLAVQSVSNAIGQISGSLAGAGIVGASGFLWAFGASLGARLIIAGSLPAVLRAPRSVGPRPEVVLRVAGYRPGVGVVHRPVVADEAESAADRADGSADTDS